MLFDTEVKWFEDACEIAFIETIDGKHYLATYDIDGKGLVQWRCNPTAYKLKTDNHVTQAKIESLELGATIRALRFESPEFLTWLLVPNSDSFRRRNMKGMTLPLKLAVNEYLHSPDGLQRVYRNW